MKEGKSRVHLEVGVGGMATSFIKSRRLATELEQELQSQSFLERCRAIVAGSSASISNVPGVIKSRGQNFQPRAQQRLRGSKLQLHVSRWNETSIKRTETMLAIALVFIAILLLALQQNESDNEPNPAQALTFSQPGASAANAAQENAEMPYFFDMLGATSENYSDSSQSAQLVPAGSSFRSYVNPEQFFSFENQGSSMTSTHAISGIAQHVEKRLLSAPELAGGLGLAAPRRAASDDKPSLRQSATHYSTTGPICGVMQGFRQLSQILDETCADGEFAGTSGGDE